MTATDKPTICLAMSMRADMMPANVRIPLQRAIDSAQTVTIPTEPLRPYCTIALCGDSNITRARNRLVSEFLYRRNEDFFMLFDDDLNIRYAYTAENNIFDRLMAHGKDYIGALYSKRAFDFGNQLSCASAIAEGWTAKPDGDIVRMRWLSGGCILVSRAAIKAMALANEHLSGFETGARGQPQFVVTLFDEFWTKRSNGEKKWLSEDWSFCQRWMDVGGEVWADPTIHLRHRGEVWFDMWGGKEPIA